MPTQSEQVISSFLTWFAHEKPAMSDGVSLLKTSGTMAEPELVHSP
jgi:hypothetical protein